MITQEAATEQVLDPQVEARLKIRLANYKMAKEAYDKAEAALGTCKADVEQAFNATGEATVLVGGYTITRVAGSSRATIDEKKLLRQGLTFAQIEAAKVYRESTGYVKITPPK